MTNIGQLHVDQPFDFDGFLIGTLRFDISVDIDDEHTKLTATVTNNRTTYQPGPNHGFGFINFAGLLWDGPEFIVDGLPLFGNPRPEDLNHVMGQMAQASGWQIPDNVIWGVCISDNYPPTYSHIVASKSTYVKNLTASDFDADGNLKDLRLVRYGARWFSGGQGGTKPGGAVVNSGNTYTIHLSQIVTDWFPWAISRGEWLSCNRSGGGVYRWGGSWREMKNSKQANKSHVFHQSNGWAVSQKTGKE